MRCISKLQELAGVRFSLTLESSICWVECCSFLLSALSLYCHWIPLRAASEECYVEHGLSDVVVPPSDVFTEHSLHFALTPIICILCHLCINARAHTRLTAHRIMWYQMHVTDTSICIAATLAKTVQFGLFLPQSQRSRAWSAELFMTGRNSELSSRPRFCLRVSCSLCCNIALSQSSSTSFICHRENVSLSSPCSRAFTT